MHLKRFTDLGLRILMHLANEADPETPHSVPELSRFLCWNQNLVIKTANAMVKAGWLSAVRGRHGGLRLACKPEDLRIGDVVRTLEDNDMLVDCNEPPCPFAGRCVLIDALARAREAFYKELNQYTLADLRIRPLEIRAGETVTDRGLAVTALAATHAPGKIGRAHV